MKIAIPVMIMKIVKTAKKMHGIQSSHLSIHIYVKFMNCWTYLEILDENIWSVSHI